MIIIYTSIKIKPILVETAKFEAEKIESTIVNEAINKIMDSNYDFNHLYSTTKNNNNEIQITDFDTTQVNKLLNLITMSIQTDLKALEKGNFEDLGISNISWNLNKSIYSKKGIVIGIPLGVSTSTTLLSDIGPKIPIKIHYLGDVNSSIYTKINEYGMNNALVEIGVSIDLSAKILLPFTSERIKLKSQIPLTIKIIQGKIPNYYANGINQNSPLYSVPLE